MKKTGLTRRQFLERTSAGLAAASPVPRRRLLRHDSPLWGDRYGASFVPGASARSGSPNALALHGGTPVRTKPFPTWPQTAELDEANILKSLRNHRWCTFDGEFIPKFEKAWAEIVGTRGCVMTPCGTHALHTALEILEIGPGDEVLVSPFTYIATIDAIMLSYALPVFVDSDVRTFQLDPEDIEHRITEHTRAILPVHILGAPAHMDKILAIAQKHRLSVIEDACQGHLAEWRGKKLGSLGTVGCFSFQESKILPGGEAGALVSNDENLIVKAYTFRDFGRDPKDGGHYVARGTKYRISDFAAAVLMAQLTRLEEVCATREKHAAYLREELKKIPGVMPQEHYAESTRQNYYVFGFRYNPEHFSGAPRERLTAALRAEGIPVSDIYPPLNKEPFIERSLHSRGFLAVYSKERLARYREQNHCPHNDELCATSLSLSHETLLGTKQDVEDIVAAVAKVQANAALV